MIFLLKYRWQTALAATLAGVLLGSILGCWKHLTGGPFSFPSQVGLGLLAGLVVLASNGLLHEVFKRVFGQKYLRAFFRHGQVVLGPMRWPEYLAGGLMAACAEEPLFRGALLVMIGDRTLGVAAAAIAFAACHWMRLEFLPFWLWALWEGLFFGILMAATGSLLVPMIAHGLHDFVGYRVLHSLIRVQAGHQPSPGGETAG